MRYEGQSFHLPIEYGEQVDMCGRFHHTFKKRYGYSLEHGPPVEVVTSSWEVEDVRDVVEDIEVETTDKVSVLEYLRKWRGQA